MPITEATRILEDEQEYIRALISCIEELGRERDMWRDKYWELVNSLERLVNAQD